jgi:hypothetical protein
VTGTDQGPTIRPSPAGALVTVLWIVFLCLVMVVGALNDHDPRGLFLVLIWLPWLVPVAWFSRFRLSVAGDVLTYRRPLHTRSWRRDQIAEFGIAQSAWRARVGYISMRTLDGETVIFIVTAGSWRRPEKMLGWLAALREWLSDTPSPDH